MEVWREKDTRRVWIKGLLIRKDGDKEELQEAGTMIIMFTFPLHIIYYRIPYLSSLSSFYTLIPRDPEVN